MDITTPYYEDNSRISNSAIGWFLSKGPLYLYKRLAGEITEESTSAMTKGTMIHEYILQPEEFNKHYVIWDKERPNSTQQENFCKELAKTLEIEPNRAILSAYKASYSTRGKSDDFMLSEGLKIASTLKDYIEFLKSNDERTLISIWDYKMLEKIKDNIRFHKLASNLIKVDEGVWTKHEFHINWEWEMLLEYSGDTNPPELLQVECKSLLDGLTLDFENKKAVIYDLKTTQKLWHFEDSIEQYDYCRQLMFYTMAVQWYLKYEFGQNSKDWSFEWYIIGIDTTGSNEIRVFKFTKDQIYPHADIIKHALTHIAWHQSTDKWEHSREYYEGDGSEHLDV